jgi:hypothetical protein
LTGHRHRRPSELARRFDSATATSFHRRLSDGPRHVSHPHSLVLASCAGRFVPDWTDFNSPRTPASATWPFAPPADADRCHLRRGYDSAGPFGTRPAGGSRGHLPRATRAPCRTRRPHEPLTSLLHLQPMRIVCVLLFFLFSPSDAGWQVSRNMTPVLSFLPSRSAAVVLGPKNVILRKQ